MEKAYKTMSIAGKGNVVVGIIMIVSGLSSGILTVIHGARLLKERKNITF